MPVIMRNEKMKIPILRRWECNSGLSSTRAQTSATLSHNLQNLGQRSGFTDVLTAYSIRRGHGNKLDVAVSAAERRSRMSHRDNDVYNSAYISTLSAIDTQAIMLDEEREDDVFENMRTMTATRDAAGAVVVGRSVGAGPIVTGQTRCKQPTKTRGDMPRGQRRKYVRDQYESLLGASIFDGGRSSDILPGGVVAEREIVRMDIERRALALLKLDRARKNIADLTDMPSDQMTIERNAKCFADVAEVGMHLLYPDSKIDEQGRCWRCYKQLKLNSANMTDSNFHLLACAKMAKAKESRDRRCKWDSCAVDLSTESSAHVAGHMFAHAQNQIRCKWNMCAQAFGNTAALEKHLMMKHTISNSVMSPADRQEDVAQLCFYCHRCAIYITAEIEWEQHCSSHVGTGDSFYGIIAISGVVVRAGTCPWCMSDATLSPSQRFHQFPRSGQLHVHSRRHMRGLEEAGYYPGSCPHRNCATIIFSTDDMCRHLSTRHGMGSFRGS